jgi:hypothetical protein
MVAGGVVSARKPASLSVRGAVRSMAEIPGKVGWGTGSAAGLTSTNAREVPINKPTVNDALEMFISFSMPGKTVNPRS